MEPMSASKNTKAASRRADVVPFEEMQRLMRVYGSTKCLRNRQTTGGKENTKVGSVKRKFYRWFPDLDERFEKDEKGFYQPKFGHEYEIKYREEMRTRDGEILAKKRVRHRKARHGATKIRVPSTKAKATSAPPCSIGSTRVPSFNLHPCVKSPHFLPGQERKRNTEFKFNHGPMASAKIATNAELLDCSFIADPNIFDKVKTGATSTVPTFTACARASPFTMVPNMTKPISFPDQEWEGDAETDMNLEFDNERTASANIIANTEPLDCSFIAEQDIFDDIEKSFSSPTDPDYSNDTLSSCCSSSSLEGHDSNDSWESECPLIKDLLDKSIEECCEEILGSDDDDASFSDFIVDMISR